MNPISVPVARFSFGAAYAEWILIGLKWLIIALAISGLYRALTDRRRMELNYIVLVASSLYILTGSLSAHYFSRLTQNNSGPALILDAPHPNFVLYLVGFTAIALVTHLWFAMLAGRSLLLASEIASGERNRNQSDWGLFSSVGSFNRQTLNLEGVESSLGDGRRFYLALKLA